MTRRILSRLLLLLLSLQNVTAMAIGVATQSDRQHSEMTIMTSDACDECCTETCESVAGCAVYCAVYSPVHESFANFFSASAELQSDLDAHVLSARKPPPLKPPPIS